MRSRFAVDPEDWRDDAACKGKQRLFFPRQGENAERARRICHTCPVIVQCAAYQQKTQSEYGVWAGQLYRMSPNSKDGEPSTHVAEDPVGVEPAALSSEAGVESVPWHPRPIRLWRQQGRRPYRTNDF